MSDCVDNTFEAFQYIDKAELERLEKEIIEMQGSGASAKDIKDFSLLQGEKLREKAFVELGDAIKVQRLKADISGESFEINSPKDAIKMIKHHAGKLLEKFEGRNSIDTSINTETTIVKNAHYGNMQDAGVLDHYKSGEFDELVMEESFRRGKQTGYKDITKDIPEGYTLEQAKIAMKITDVAKKTTNFILKNQRSVGIPIAKRNDWLFKHSYSHTKMASMGPDAFVSLLRKHGNIKDMFADGLDGTGIDEVLAGIHKEIVDGKAIYRSGDSGPSFLNKLKSRKIEFKSGIDENNFFKEVSDHTSLLENMEVSMDQAGRTYGIVKTLGVDSDRNFKHTMSSLEKEFSRAIDGKFTPEETDRLIKKYGKELHKAQDSYKIVAANPYSPKGRVTNIANVLKSLNSMTKLGSSLFTSMYDGMTLSLQYSAATGDNQFKSMMKVMQGTTKVFRGTEARQRMARMVNVAGYLNDPAIAMGGNKGDFKTGMDRFNKFVGKAYSLTGVPMQTEMSRNLGGMLQGNAMKRAVDDFGLGNLNEFQKLKIERYGLNDADMKILGAMKNDYAEDIIAPPMVFDIPLKEFHADEDVAYKMRRDLFDKIGNWMEDTTKSGTPTPTARQKRILRKGEHIENEEIRAITSLVMQFKETAHKILDDNLAAWEDFGKASGGMGQAKGLGLYAVNGMISYMLIENTKAFLLGNKSPMDKYKKNGGKALFLDYVNKASFLPLLTDFGGAASDNQFWRSSVPNTLFGPTFSMGMDGLAAMHNPNRKNIGKALKHVTPLLPTYAPVKAFERHLLHNDLFTGQKIRK